MSIDNLKNLHANKEDYPGLNVPDNPDYYLSAAEYNHLVNTLKEFIDDYNIKMSGDRPSQVLPILKTGDPTNLTNDNVLSSLRTIWEISNMLNSFTGMFLSRKNDDSAEGNIKFKKDVFFGDFLSGSLGVTGKGGRITNEGRAELASLSLREWLEVPELRYKRTEVITGDKWRAPGGGIIESVNLLTQELTLKLEDGEYGALEVDDLCMGIFHSMDNSNNATETTDDGRNNRTLKGFATAYFKITEALNPEENNSRFKYELRHVSDPSWTKKVHPEKFMHFAAFGNTTKAHRQSSAYETRTYQRFLINMNSWTNDMSNIAAQFGEMENLNTFGTGQTFSGYSVYLNNIYLSGAIEAIKLPYIGKDGYWYIWNNTLGAYVSSGTKAEGKDGEIINAIRYELITSVKEVSRNDAGIPDVPTVFCQILKKDVESDETLNYVPNGHSLYYSINGNTRWHEYPINSLISISPTAERYDFILKHGDAIVSRAEINIDSGGRLNLRFNPERVSVSVDEDTRAIIDGLPVEIDIIFKYGINEPIAPTEVELTGPSWLTDALEVSEDKTKILVKEIDFLYSDINRFNVEVFGKYGGATVSMVGSIEVNKTGSAGKSAVVRSLKPSTNIIKRNEAGAPDINPVFCEIVESLGDDGGFTLGNLPSGYKIKYSKNRGLEIDYAYKGNINVGNPDEVISFFLYNNGIKIDQADILIWPANKKPIYIDSLEAFVPIKVNENYNVISGLPITIPLNLYYGDDLMGMQSLSINPSVTGVTYTTASDKRSIEISGISNIPFNNKDSFSFNLVGVGILHGTTITRTKKVIVQRTFDGIKGDDALIYSLKANNPVLIVGNNGSFKGPNSVKVNILKTVGEDVQVLGAKPYGYTLQYKKNSGSAVTYTYNSNIALTTTDTQITFELLKGSTLIDTITIPILKDGVNGINGVFLHFDNSFVLTKVSDNNLHLSGLPAHIGVKMFYGTEEMTITSLVNKTANVNVITSAINKLITINNVDAIQSEIVEIKIEATGTYGGKSYTVNNTILVAKLRDGEQGPAGITVPLVFRGEWNKTSEYYGQETRIDLVKVTDDVLNTVTYYSAHPLAGKIQGEDKKPSTNSQYWTKFEGNFHSVATDLLLAEKANIGGFAFTGYTKAIDVPAQSIISQVGLNWATGNPVDLMKENSIIDKFLPNLTLNGEQGYIKLRDSILFNSDGTGYLANNNLKWDALGNLHIGLLKAGKYFNSYGTDPNIPLYVEFSEKGYSYWHFPFKTTDKYIRLKIGNGHWSEPHLIQPGGDLQYDTTKPYYKYQFFATSTNYALPPLDGDPGVTFTDNLSSIFSGISPNKHMWLRRALITPENTGDYEVPMKFTPENGYSSNYDHPIKFGSDGSGWLANKNISWDAGGELTVRGKIEAITGTLGNLTMQSGGRILLPPTFGGSYNGQITQKGIDLAYKPSTGETQKIEWNSGPGTHAGRFIADAQGRLVITSDFGINIGVELYGNPGISISREVFHQKIDMNNNTLSNIRELSGLGKLQMVYSETSILKDTTWNSGTDALLLIFTSVGTNAGLSHIKRSTYKNGDIIFLMNASSTNYISFRKDPAGSSNIRNQNGEPGSWRLYRNAVMMLIYYEGYWRTHNDYGQ